MLSVDQTTQKASANAADNSAALTVNGISASGAGTGSKHLTGRARSKHEQGKNRVNRES